MTRFLATFSLAAMCVVLAGRVQASPEQCEGREGIVTMLTAEFGEHLIEVHPVSRAGLLEFHASPLEGTWTALVTDTQMGVSCIIAIGEGLSPEKVERVISPFQKT